MSPDAEFDPALPYHVAVVEVDKPDAVDTLQHALDLDEAGRAVMG